MSDFGVERCEEKIVQVGEATNLMRGLIKVTRADQEKGTPEQGCAALAELRLLAKMPVSTRQQSARL
jgi:hypothetical protein